jgi:predicted PurR-regulated permease PerM
MKDDKILNISISTGTIVRGIVIILTFALVYFIRDIIVIVFVAALVASILEPLVRKVSKRAFPKALATLIVLFLILGFLGLIVGTLIKPIAIQTKGLVDQIQTYLQNFSETDSAISDWFTSNQFIFDKVKESAAAFEKSIVQSSNIFAFITAFFGSFATFILIIVLSYYMIVEEREIKEMIKRLLPRQYRSYLIDLFKRIQTKIGLWARGYLISAIIVWFLVLVCLIVLKIPYPLALSSIVFITSLIPMIGPLLAAIPAVFVAFFQSPLQAVLVAVCYEVISLIESYFITPNVMRRTLGLNPVVIIIVLLIGARFAGILGILLAIPIATALSVFIQDLINKNK